MNKVMLVVTELMIVMVTMWMDPGGFTLRQDSEKGDVEVDGGGGGGGKGRSSSKNSVLILTLYFVSISKIFQ